MNQNDSDLISFDFKYNPNKKIIFQKPQLPIIYSNSTSSYKDSTIKGKPSSSNQLNNLNRGNLIFKHLNNISYHNKQRSKFLDNSSYISNKILSNINNNILSYKESKQDILDCKYNNNDIYLLKKIKPIRKNKSNYYTKRSEIFNSKIYEISQCSPEKKNKKIFEFIQDKENHNEGENNLKTIIKENIKISHISNQLFSLFRVKMDEKWQSLSDRSIDKDKFLKKNSIVDFKNSFPHQKGRNNLNVPAISKSAIKEPEYKNFFSDTLKKRIIEHSPLLFRNNKKKKEKNVNDDIMAIL
jgi:hypothetical protein